MSNGIEAVTDIRLRNVPLWVKQSFENEAKSKGLSLPKYLSAYLEEQQVKKRKDWHNKLTEINNKFIKEHGFFAPGEINNLVRESRDETS